MDGRWMGGRWVCLCLCTCEMLCERPSGLGLQIRATVGLAA